MSVKYIWRDKKTNQKIGMLTSLSSAISFEIIFVIEDNLYERKAHTFKTFLTVCQNWLVDIIIN